MLHSLKQQNVIEIKTRYYGIAGELKEDNANALAKEVTGKSTRYYCKFNTSGVEAGHLFNPWSMYSDPAVKQINTINKLTGKFAQEYKEISKEVFDMYLRYLDSQSDVYYRQAERMALEHV